MCLLRSCVCVCKKNASLDAALLGAIKAMLKAYLAASFSLKKGQYPRALML